MKKINKISTFALLFLMSVFVLTACSRNDGSGTGTTQSPTQSSSQKSQESSSQSGNTT